MTLVVDASVVVGALVLDSEAGRWCEARLTEQGLVAPHLLPAEVANSLRRRVHAGQVSEPVARGLLSEVGQLALTLFPYEPFGERIWELRNNLTTYDAWYVSLAEAYGCPLATLDHRLVGAPGPRCELLTPSG